MTDTISTHIELEFTVAMIRSAVQMAFDCGSVTLRNGKSMPLVGLGTYTVRGPECASAVCAALTAGYRHIDTAAIYRNETDVADGIAASGVPREEIFITSKMKPQDHGAKAYDAALASLAALRTDYLDLFLVHWPGVGGMKLDDSRMPHVRMQTWRAFERLYDEGKVRAIGVSNYTPKHLAELCESDWVSVKPMVNQFELHPLLQQRDIVAACQKHGIAIEAYSSLARAQPELLAHPVVTSIATTYSVTAAQVCLKWAVQKGYVVIPKSTNEARIVGNGPGLIKGGWTLSADDMASLDSLETDSTRLRTCWNPFTVLA